MVNSLIRSKLTQTEMYVSTYEDNNENPLIMFYNSMRNSTEIEVNYRFSFE